MATAEHAGGAMEPGQGAEEQASRRARRLERLRREAAASADVDTRVSQAIAAEQRRVRAWSAGAEGERMVAAALESLAPYGWTALHDVHWPGRPLANIDHIAIGPGGVVVIDAKNWTGDITLTDGRLRQNGYSRAREVDGVSSMTAAVVALLAPQHRMATVGMICLAGQDVAVTRLETGVAVVGRLQLAEALVALRPRLTPYDVADIGHYLTRELRAPQRSAARRSTQTTRRGPATTGQGTRIRPAPNSRRRPGRRPASRRRARAGLGEAVFKIGGLIVGLLVLQAVLRGLGTP